MSLSTGPLTGPRPSARVCVCDILATRTRLRRKRQRPGRIMQRSIKNEQ